ncbi:MAG: hypothetical protein HY738_11985, partial [Bacteroidia bacterium]|nr:hypothetical protein [Bacteroidia bacterium]
MKQYLKHLILLFKRLLLLLLLFQLSRLFFFIFNLDYFRGISFSDALLTFFFGTRFDISAIILFNCIFIILHIIPGNFKSSYIYQIILKILFFTVNSFILLFNFTDAEYFKFINKRTTFDFFSLINTGMDFWHLVPQFIKDYWYIPLAWLIMILLAWFLYPKFRFKLLEQKKLKLKQLIIQLFLFLFI